MSTYNYTPVSIVKDYGWVVSSLTRRMIHDESLVNDAMQEVWLEIIKSLPQFNGQSKISTWLYTIAYRKILKFASKEKQYTLKFLHQHFQGEMLYADETRDKEEWVREQCDRCLTGILHCLDNETRLIYILREIAELSYDDIAEITALSKINIRKIISRTRKKLNQFLKKECRLYNPESQYKCRMHGHVKEINLQAEYQKIRKSVHQIRILKESQKIFPSKNYWLEQIS